MKHIKEHLGIESEQQTVQPPEKGAGSKGGYMGLLSKVKDKGQNVISILQNSLSDNTTHRVTKTVENIL